MIIQHNMSAANANRMLGMVVTDQSKSIEKLSSGYRINRAADDAAGLSISEKMRGQIRGLEQASTNAQDGISMIQTAEGALNETHAILQRMRELAVQAANGTETSDDRAAIQLEVDQLIEEIDRISDTTQFNTMNLLDGTLGDAGNGTVTFHVGANANQEIDVTIGDMSAATLGVDAIKVDNVANANTTITAVDEAIKLVSAQRSNLGAVQNRLEHTIDNLDTSAENLQTAESRIRDVDMAEEMVTYTKNSVLQQAAQSILAQANQTTSSVLSLLQ